MNADDTTMQADIAALLRQTARAHSTTTYAAVAAAAGLPISDPASRARIAHLLYAVNAVEHAQGRPLLSTVVVFVGQRRPGAGFFQCARDLGRLTDEEPLTFWAAELQRVYAVWHDQTP